MLSAHLHPEFGLFCPSPGLRRGIWVALAFTVFGLIVGANGVATLMADHDPDIDHVLMAARPEGSEAASQAVQAPVVKAEARSTATAEPDAAKAEPVKAEPVKIDAGRWVAAKIDAIKVDAVKTDAAKSDATKTSCEENTWAYLDGTCVVGKPRKVRIVRTAPAKVAAPTVPVANTPVVAAASAVTEPSQRAGVAAKKPQKSASSQNRRRDQAGSDDPSRREVRPGRFGTGGFANVTGQQSGPFGPGGFFSLFR
jgi:hypothetical protein